MHPTTFTVTVDYATPVAVFGDYLQGHVTTLENPIDAVAQTRPPAHVNFLSLQADTTRNWKVGDPSPFRRQKPSEVMAT